MIEQLIRAGRQIVAEGLARGWGGNLSGRYHGNLAITRSGADLGQLTHSDFVVVAPHAPLSQQRLPKPSSELAMHIAAY
ncbi:MAG: class II aldolase/adducin family protein, partial [Anaerolineae bacterium]